MKIAFYIFGFVFFTRNLQQNSQRKIFCFAFCGGAEQKPVLAYFACRQTSSLTSTENLLIFQDDVKRAFPFWN
jgi:hypothetical protein